MEQHAQHAGEAPAARTGTGSQSDAPTYIFIVGGETYVFREIRRRLMHLGADTAGHAQKHWIPPFHFPRYTTAMLVVEDDCPGPLKMHALRIGTAENIPVIVAPARNKWNEAEELLRKAGILEAIPGGVESLMPPPKDESRATIADAIRAKGEEPPHVESPPPSSPAETPPSPDVATQPEQEEPMPALRFKSPQAIEAKMKLAERILVEKKGLINNKDVMNLVHQKLGKGVGGFTYEVWRKIRSKNKLPFPPQGGFKNGVRAMPAPRAAVNGATKPTVAKPAARPPVNETLRPAVQPSSPQEADGAFAQAFREALMHVRDGVLTKFNVAEADLLWKDGKWEVRKIARAKQVVTVQVVEEKIEL